MKTMNRRTLIKTIITAMAGLPFIGKAFYSQPAFMDMCMVGLRTPQAIYESVQALKKVANGRAIKLAHSPLDDSGCVFRFHFGGKQEPLDLSVLSRGELMDNGRFKRLATGIALSAIGYGYIDPAFRLP